jgi:hypothetical protein
MDTPELRSVLSVREASGAPDPNTWQSLVQHVGSPVTGSEHVFVVAVAVSSHTHARTHTRKLLVNCTRHGGGATHTVACRSVSEELNCDSEAQLRRPARCDKRRVASDDTIVAAGGRSCHPSNPDPAAVLVHYRHNSTSEELDLRRGTPYAQRSDQRTPSRPSTTSTPHRRTTSTHTHQPAGRQVFDELAQMFA